MIKPVCLWSGGNHGRDRGGRVSSLSAQRAHVSHLSGHAEEHHDDQRMSAPLLLRLHRHGAAVRVSMNPHIRDTADVQVMRHLFSVSLNV